MRLKLVKFVVLAYCAVLTVSLAAFYLLPEYPQRGAASGDTRSEWSFESREGWQEQFPGIHVREQWQFTPPGENLTVTATEPLSGLWVLVERTDGDKIEVIEYGVAPQLADLIRSYAVELRDGGLVITPPPFYEVELASFSRDFTEVQFFAGDDPGPDYGGGHSVVNLLFDRQIMLLKVPQTIELEFDEKNIYPIVVWD